MDQEPGCEPLSSVITRKLNAQAPEFVPLSASSASPVAVMQHGYATPPVRLPPPQYFGYDRYFQQNAMPFYGYNNHSSPVEVTADRSSGSAAPAASTQNGLSDAHDKILNQVEFYFSDINLATTDQLFGFMSKDPQGYVPLSVVASFKKIKAAINGSTQLVSILRTSKKLSVSEDGKKVKRQVPLTESDMEELQSRIVIAENLPEDRSHQNLMKVFSSVGRVKSIRTCPPQKYDGGASSASKAGKGDPMHFSSKFHAFVEYESVEATEKAVVELTDEGNWRNGLKVRLLLKSVVKHAQNRSRKVGHEGQPFARNDEVAVSEMQHLKANQSEDSFPQSDSPVHEHQVEDNGNSSNVPKKGRNYGGGSGKQGKGKGHGRGRPLYPNSSSNNGSILRPPTEASTKSSSSSTVPRMPDGTRGFSMGRGKLLAIKIS